jgi:hypothetical protein
VDPVDGVTDYKGLIMIVVVVVVGGISLACSGFPVAVIVD